MKILLKKVTVEILCISMLSVLSFTIMNKSKAQTYDPYDVQVINNLIKNNGLNAKPDAPESWWFASWSDEAPKKVTELSFYMNPYDHLTLSGAASFAGLTTLQILNCFDGNLSELDVSNCTALKELECSWNNITKLDITNCTNLQTLYCIDNNLTELDVVKCTQLINLACSYNPLGKLDVTNCIQLEILDCNVNKLTKLDVTKCTQLNWLSCIRNSLTELDLSALKNDYMTVLDIFDQYVSLTLYKDENGTYNFPVKLNAPFFENADIIYENGILKSKDKTVTSTVFSVQTNKQTYELCGTMNFTYSDVGIISLDKEQIKTYLNPINNTLFVECEDYIQITVKLYDINGKEVLTHNTTSNNGINVNHLQKGVYLVNVFLDGKIIGNTKIVKQ